MQVKLPEPISGGLLLSYQCNAECRHCMYACLPKWKDWISEKDLEEILTANVRLCENPLKIIKQGYHFGKKKMIRGKYEAYSVR